MITNSEKDKMLRGELYNPTDKELVDERNYVKDLCFQLNNTKPSDSRTRRRILHSILQNVDFDTVEILSPFMVDYGYNIEIGENSFINHNSCFLDCAKIKIGKHCFIGPNCGFYTAIHPLIVEQRNKGLETAKPITIKDNVWIGGDVTILPGVTIGEGSVIGAKSLVDKDIPSGVVAAGNPCRVIKRIGNELFI